MTTHKGDENSLQVDLEPPLGWITINRPAAHNALTAKMWGDLSELVKELVRREEVRVIILRGAGEKSFIAGADIGGLKAQLDNPDLGRVGYHFTIDLLSTLQQADKPIIAMINGYCFGGGLLIALGCDLRIASTRASFGIPAAKLGVAYPPQHGVMRLVHTVGITAANDLLLSGSTIDSAESLRIGLVNRVVEPNELLSYTREYAVRIAAGAPLSLAAHKKAVNYLMAEMSSSEVEDAVLRCYSSQDCQEGLSAYLEKRSPDFHGK